MTPAEKLASTIVPRKRKRGKVKVVRKIVFKCSLRERRERLGLTLCRVAKAIGMSTSGLHAVEQGCDPMVSTMFRLCAFFGASPNELWKPL